MYHHLPMKIPRNTVAAAHDSELRARDHSTVHLLPAPDATFPYWRVATYAIFSPPPACPDVDRSHRGEELPGATYISPPLRPCVLQSGTHLRSIACSLVCPFIVIVMFLPRQDLTQGLNATGAANGTASLSPVPINPIPGMLSLPEIPPLDNTFGALLIGTFIGLMCVVGFGSAFVSDDRAGG